MESGDLMIKLICTLSDTLIYQIFSITKLHNLQTNFTIKFPYHSPHSASIQSPY